MTIMDYREFCKPLFRTVAVCALVSLAACSVNPLTGKEEFTGLMSPQQEQSIGAEQHTEIVKQYGGEYKNQAVQSYVNEIGQKLAAQSDRKDVQYHFTVLDSPVVNAFALPGGYVYVTRGTLAVANSEAELAAVLGHEIGHVAARHQAARYSQGVLTQLGASVLSAAIGMPAASQAIGMGTNLYMSSYSRDQESQADQLGVRYLSRTGYDTMAMSYFLKDMEQFLSVEASVQGKKQQSAGYFSSHPDTGGRVVAARAEAQKYQQEKATENRNQYVSMIRGLMFGENPAQGFMRGNTFYHPDIGFAFSVPDGFNLDNKPERIAIEGREGTILVLDMTDGKGMSSADQYVSQVWLKGRAPEGVESMDVNGMHAATTSVPVTINNQPATVRLLAIEWGTREFVRMQMMLPAGVSSAAVDDLKRITYSFHQMTNAERKLAKPYQIDLVKASVGDSVQSLASRMNVEKLPVEQFAALNGMTPAEPIVAGRLYKIIR